MTKPAAEDRKPEREEQPDQRLPVSEVTFDRPGGPSPFGEDVTFPLPVEQLRYQHS